MDYSKFKYSQYAEYASKVMACAALFSIVLPTAVPNIFLGFFLVFWILAGNYKFKIDLVINNPVAVLCIVIFLLFLLGLIYTSATTEDSLKFLKKYSKFLYVPLLLSAFTTPQWRRYGYISFLSGVTLMLLMSYMTLLGWSPDSIYSGAYSAARQVDPIVFRSRIAHSTLVAFAAFLFLIHAINNKRFRIVFVALAVLASFNVLGMMTSRTGQVVWLALMILLIYQRFSWKYLVVGIILVPILTVGTIFSFEKTRVRMYELVDDYELIVQNQYSSALGLRYIWAHTGLEIIKNNLLVGTGTGSYKEEFIKIIETRNIPNKNAYTTMNPHNEYISIGVQLGILGLIAYLLLLIKQWMLSRYLPNSMGKIAQGMIITIAVGGLFNSVIYAHTQGIFFVLFSALLFASYSKQTISEN